MGLKKDKITKKEENMQQDINTQDALNVNDNTNGIDKDNGSSSTNTRIDELTAELEKAKEENSLIKNQLLKALADYSNLERDIDKRMGIVMLQNRLQLVKALFKTIDDVNFAFKSAESITFNEETQNWFNGVKVILDDLNKALVELGVETIVVNKGDAFDASIHEAISTVPTEDEKQSGRVFDIVQVGFKIGDAVIRPARVVIFKANK